MVHHRAARLNLIALTIVTHAQLMCAQVAYQGGQCQEIFALKFAQPIAETVQLILQSAEFVIQDFSCLHPQQLAPLVKLVVPAVSGFQ